MAGRIDKPFPDMHTLQEVIAAVQGLCLRNHGTRVSIGEIVQMFGPRSFAPLILAIGLIAVTPIDSIPTLPTTFVVIILLTVGQMLMGRQFLWLPKFIANRAVNADRLGSALDWLLPYARWADKRLGARLPMLTRGAFLPVIAMCCALLAALMPMMELVPLVSTLPALAFASFGIALLMHDGAAALVGFSVTAVTLILITRIIALPF